MAKKEKIDRVKMPEQDPDVRRRNFEEVPLGLTEEMAMTEAKRCLQCKKPSCVDGCPVSVLIPEFIKCIAEGDFSGATAKLWERNALPAVCGRVCPQEEQCEGKCIVGKKDRPVAIGYLERFAADYERKNGTGDIPAVAEKTGKKVAVIGSGPSGLTVAGDLLLKGHDVTISKRFTNPAESWFTVFPNFVCPRRSWHRKWLPWKKWGPKSNATPWWGLRSPLMSCSKKDMMPHISESGPACPGL